MGKTSKDIARELLTQCNTPEGKKEVVNACLFTLHMLTTNLIPESPKELQDIAGGTLNTYCNIECRK